MALFPFPPPSYIPFRFPLSHSHVRSERLLPARAAMLLLHGRVRIGHIQTLHHTLHERYMFGPRLLQQSYVHRLPLGFLQ